MMKTASVEKQSPRIVGDVHVDTGREPQQMGWYRYAAQNLVAGKRVIDIGCGMAKGLDLLQQFAREARGQDLDSRLGRPDIDIIPISEIPDKSYDVVTCVDVVEHVGDDAGFVRELARIAREAVFLTTPNSTATRFVSTLPNKLGSVYHVREYTPQELRSLLSPLGEVIMLKGSETGDRIFPVRQDAFYDFFNSARCWPPTAQLARVWNNLIPQSMRIQSHNGAILKLRVGR